ncbi:MAG: DUF4249 domain-containing protein [Bacteroidales bacterium]|nr:DUF4249 domain-containing protein [Bacteroidales bacterium]
MKQLRKILVFASMAFFAACTEDIVIDVEEGNHRIGVEASFTNELKRHETILSYTADFYNQNEIQMVSGATVYVTDGVDTMYYYEDEEQPGHYFTDSVAGRKNTVYRLSVEAVDQDGESQSLFAEGLIPDNVESIDSLAIKHYNGSNDSIPSVFLIDTVEWVYPYFQSLPDPGIIYMPKVWKNDTLVSDSLSLTLMIPQGGFAGYYVNGPEMLESNKEIPIGYFLRSKLNDGDEIRADLYSITPDYYYYFYSILMSTGSNPMLGAPANVSSNIQPEGEGVGWFFTASVVTGSTVFRK